MKQPGPRVEVVWQDPGGSTGWHDPRDVADAFDHNVVHSVGYLVEDSDRGVVLVAGYEEGKYLDSTTIPRGVVQSVTPLRVDE
jgi:hypothetical protein